MDSIEKQLETVITIDGQGRPKKTELLITLLETNKVDDVILALKNLKNTCKFYV